ncbi:MAG: metal-dependent hydrolase [Chloroflexi bacterium]|nr:metal-dependent hydrolase [Chloroflexota bacterium]
MATPVAHSLIGLAGAMVTGSRADLNIKAWYMFSMVAANAPDLDLLPGLLVGDINRFHQGVSHSLAAGLLFGIFTVFVVRVFRWKVNAYFVGIIGAVLYLSHLLVDLQVEDLRAPFGIPLLAPFSSEHFLVSWLPFQGVKDGVPGDSVVEFAMGLFSWNNLGVIGVELAITVPLLIIAWIISRPDNRLMRRNITKKN